ncbi:MULTISPECIES: NAD(P)-dependent oxidoreductase [unclassified Psychromonas]|uniref:NAD(P)-dependent oxidoreductase n=1 Tax=unclassified Psychromonas TaxID=2614957 RepID=UPI0003F881F2|nr:MULTISPECIES: NAD(P)-dependent oxidoreductase [unclassified Psychromonas]
MKVGIVGLGNMGAGMASTLAKKKRDVYGFDSSKSAREAISHKGVKPVSTLKELTSICDIIVLSLPKAEHVEAVCLGENGIGKLASPGLIVIDTTTSEADVSRKVASSLRTSGIKFIDAPVSGGPLGAASGTMSMVIGGEKDVVESVLSLLQDMSVTQVHIGDVGAGNIAKIANNLLCAAHLITNAEVVSLAVKAGVDPEKVLEGINAGSGRSGVSQVNFPKWILNNGYDSGFSMGLMRKDVGLAKKLADDLNLSLPLSRQIIQMWQQSQDITDQEDFNAIVKASDPTLF